MAQHTQQYTTRYHTTCYHAIPHHTTRHDTTRHKRFNSIRTRSAETSKAGQYFFTISSPTLGHAFPYLFFPEIIREKVTHDGSLISTMRVDMYGTRSRSLVWLMCDWVRWFWSWKIEMYPSTSKPFQFKSVNVGRTSMVETLLSSTRKQFLTFPHFWKSCPVVLIST